MTANTKSVIYMSAHKFVVQVFSELTNDNDSKVTGGMSQAINKWLGKPGNNKDYYHPTEVNMLVDFVREELVLL
ncbi:MAG: hypothetical protein ACJAS1_001608 [Oleiphilaceae bacterium]|jgi:hypothetical protein